MFTRHRAGAAQPALHAHGPAPRLKGLTSQSGAAAIVLVMAIMFAVLLIGIALFALGGGETGVVEYSVDSTRALWLAESGLERARGWLGELFADDPTANPLGQGLEHQPLGGGDYTYTVTDVNAGFGGLPEFTVLSTGVLDGATRQIRAVLTPETFSHFQWFVDSQAPDTWFVTGDYFEGPVHMNGHLRVDGDPWFGAQVTAAGDYIEAPNSHPTFTAGYQTNVEPIPLPDYSEINQTLRADAMDHGLYGPALQGNGSYYQVVLGRDGNLGTLSYRRYEGGYSPWTDRSIASLGGAAWFDSEVWLEGTIDGELTIGCSGPIWITDNVLFADSTPGQGPNPGCDDLMGIVGLQEIFVKDTPANRHDCEIHGIMMALNRRFQVEDWNQPPARGTLTLWGGIIANQAWFIGTFVQGVARSGYDPEWHYDPRMLRMFPPYFPLTGNMTLLSWEEIVPPEV